MSRVLHLTGTVTARLTAELGLRWDEQTYVEDADEQFGPRLNLLYDLSDDTRLRASWGRYQQAAGIDELQVEDGVDEYPRAQRADHLIVGLEHTLSNDWQLARRGLSQGLRRPPRALREPVRSDLARSPTCVAIACASRRSRPAPMARGSCWRGAARTRGTAG
jgi:hypothetical protein